MGAAANGPRGTNEQGDPQTTLPAEGSIAGCPTGDKRIGGLDARGPLALECGARHFEERAGEGDDGQ